MRQQCRQPVFLVICLLAALGACHETPQDPDFSYPDFGPGGGPPSPRPTGPMDAAINADTSPQTTPDSSTNELDVATEPLDGTPGGADVEPADASLEDTGTPGMGAGPDMAGGSPQDAGVWPPAAPERLLCRGRSTAHRCTWFADCLASQNCTTVRTAMDHQAALDFCEQQPALYLRDLCIGISCRDFVDSTVYCDDLGD